MGIRAGAPYRLIDVLGRLPFKSFNTKKRASGIFAEIGECMLQGQDDIARGLVAQAMRWLALSLHLQDEDAAWKLTMLPDPLSTPTAELPRRPDLQNAGLQDVGQVTALCSLMKDEEALGLKVHKAGGGGGGDGEGGRRSSICVAVSDSLGCR